MRTPDFRQPLCMISRALRVNIADQLVAADRRRPHACHAPPLPKWSLAPERVPSHSIAIVDKHVRSQQESALTPTCVEVGIPEFFGRRLQTSMTRATVKDSTAGLGQILVRGVFWLVGYPSMASRGCARIPWRMGCQEEFKARVFETRVSCSGGRPTTRDPHALRGERRRPHLKHSKKKKKR